jgi:hypothetical protein
MRLKTLLAILSVLVLTSCDDKPNAYMCTFIYTPPTAVVLADGSLEVTDNSYSFCVNYQDRNKTFKVPVGEMGKWVTTDLNNHDIIKDWYQKKYDNKTCAK